MAHFKLIKSDDLFNGPVDYSTPIGDIEVYLCSNTVRDHVERRRPAKRKFTADSTHNKFWFDKFCIHADANPEYVRFARGKSGRWYVEAVSF